MHESVTFFLLQSIVLHANKFSLPARIMNDLLTNLMNIKFELNGHSHSKKMWKMWSLLSLRTCGYNNRVWMALNFLLVACSILTTNIFGNFWKTVCKILAWSTITEWLHHCTPVFWTECMKSDVAKRFNSLQCHYWGI